MNTEKFIYVIRHAARGPTYKIKKLEKMLVAPSSPDLLKTGESEALVYGQNLAKKLELVDEEVLAFSSPQTRCQQTLQQIILGMRLDVEMIVDYKLTLGYPSKLTKFPDVFEMFPESEEYERLYFNYYSMMSELEDALEIEDGYKSVPKTKKGFLTGLHLICSYGGNLLCYQNLGLDLSEIIPADIMTELFIIHGLVYHFIFSRLYQLLKDKLIDLVKYLLSFPEKIIIVTSHDAIIYLLILLIKDMTQSKIVYPYPNYLATITIHQTSEFIRVRYGDHDLDQIKISDLI